MEEWKEYRLGDFMDVKGGKRLPKGENLITTPNTHPYIRVRDLGASKILELNSTFEYVDDDTQKSIARYIVNEGDIIISIVGTIGLIGVIGESLNKANLTENCVKLVNINGLDRDFLYYYLISSFGENEIKKGILGAVQAKLPIKNIQNIVIKAPSLPTQQKIANILSSLDDKIEVNRRINEQLEELAQALFKSWFVDFEPFKDGKFVESELGMIPEGWKVGNLLDVATLYDSMRKPLSGRERDSMEKIYPYYGATSIMDYVDKYIFDGIYLLMGEDGSVVDDKGFPILQYVWGKFWPNNHAHVMQGKNGFTTEMLHSLLSITNVKSVVTGAVQAKISQMGMKKINIVIAPNELLEDFSMKIAPIYDKIRANSEEITHLTNLRDTLLPKLMSGEIDVNEVEI